MQPGMLQLITAEQPPLEPKENMGRLGQVLVFSLPRFLTSCRPSPTVKLSTLANQTPKFIFSFYSNPTTPNPCTQPACFSFITKFSLETCEQCKFHVHLATENRKPLFWPPLEKAEVTWVIFETLWLLSDQSRNIKTRHTPPSIPPHFVHLISPAASRGCMTLYSIG